MIPLSNVSSKPELLDILACPECKGPLKALRDPQRLACDRCRRAYPFSEDGIPIMLPEEAEHHEPDSD